MVKQHSDRLKILFSLAHECAQEPNNVVGEG